LTFTEIIEEIGGGPQWSERRKQRTTITARRLKGCFPMSQNGVQGPSLTFVRMKPMAAMRLSADFGLLDAKLHLALPRRQHPGFCSDSVHL